MTRKNNMNILLIGVGYFPWLTSGEKNFFYQLLPILQEQCGIVVFSLNDYPEKQISQQTPLGTIPVYCARRALHRNYEQFFFQGNGYTSYHHRHSPPREIVEKFTSVVSQLPRLRRIIKYHHIKVIHFMDNFGIAMPFLRMAFPNVKVTYSAANYDPRSRQSFYDAYLKISLGYLHGAGVYTHAYLKKLRELGIKIPCSITPWGVPVPQTNLSLSQKEGMRQELGIPQGQILLLWSGYLQQIQEHDYYKTIAVARQVIQQRDDITFLFAFKPETFKPTYAEEAGKHILVQTGLKNFTDVLETADLFCSPISNTHSTVSPPLTWLEAMIRATPVVTTNIGGVSEVINHQETGYIAQNYDDLTETILQNVQKTSLTKVSQQAQALAKTQYSITNSAQHYLHFWQEIAAI
ncbi:MAG TPA: glycosyltransferase family 4 protein [Chloroflexota bacterium]|nr:glycosyltransferase family 4 protein [Chloroflexota bacterium]